ncbi:MAG: iron complex transport system permease protein [Chloroflexi bacterium]|jgi:iron complex transport system permease protein|nr:MAG: iron complex transport system permease protein [Chloroflexota bacterium]|tara:strand:- start:713 stop:1786 length:1074 start_codon:yes stop_codon:yes gene_type:complete
MKLNSQIKIMTININFKSKFAITLIMCISLISIIFFSLTVGIAEIPVSIVARSIINVMPFIHFDLTISNNWEQIIFDIRLPRIIAAGIVGAGLSCAGVTYQGVFRNHLADPYLLGIASGAALAVTIANYFVPPNILFSFLWIQLFAFFGGLLVICSVYLMAFIIDNRNFSTIILTGIALSSLCTSLTFFLLMMQSTRGLSILSFLFGSFNTADWNVVIYTAPIIILGIIFLIFFGRTLNILQIGPEEAKTLGIKTHKMNMLLIFVASIITCSAVALAGIIGFVGLIIPHLCRLFFGNDYTKLLMFSGFIGAMFLILVDDSVRTIIAPREIPIGAMTALVGSPLFIYFLFIKSNGHDL